MHLCWRYVGYGPEGLCGFFGFPTGSVHHTDPGGVGGTVLHQGVGVAGGSAWPPASCACVRCLPPRSRAGNNKQTAERTGNDLGKIGVVFSAGAGKCLHRGLSNPALESLALLLRLLNSERSRSFGVLVAAARARWQLLGVGVLWGSESPPDHVCKCHWEVGLVAHPHHC